MAGDVIHLCFSGRPDPTTIPGLMEELTEFSSRSGQEKQSWVDLSIDGRIEATKKLGGSVLGKLHWARFSVYRHSSEILHGTFFSVLFSLGLTAPSSNPRSAKDCAKELGENHVLVLMSVILSLSAAVEAFHRAFGFQSVFDSATQAFNELATIPHLAELQ